MDSDGGWKILLLNILQNSNCEIEFTQAVACYLVVIYQAHERLIADSRIRNCTGLRFSSFTNLKMSSFFGSALLFTFNLN